MKNFINVARSRRGIAIEMAIGVMFLTVAFSVLLVSISLMQLDKSDGARESLTDKIAVMQILENVENGDYTLEEGENVITEGGVIVTVEISGGKIVSWQKQ